jgi:hypothetical protein
MTAFKAAALSPNTRRPTPPLPSGFPLLCPVREGDWASGLAYRLIHSDSGIAQKGCVFATPKHRRIMPSESHRRSQHGQDQAVHNLD